MGASYLENEIQKTYEYIINNVKIFSYNSLDIKKYFIAFKSRRSKIA